MEKIKINFDRYVTSYLLFPLYKSIVLIAFCTTIAFLFSENYSIDRNIESNVRNLSYIISTYIQIGDFISIKRIVDRFESTSYVKVKVYDLNRLYIAGDGNENLNQKMIKILNSGKNEVGFINYSYALYEHVNYQNYIIILLLIIFFFGLINFMIKRFINQFTKSIKEQIFYLKENIKSVDSHAFNNSFEIVELDELNNDIRNLIGIREEHLLNIENYKKNVLISALASQVSHDIRSPLSALNMMMCGLDQLPEEKRTLIRNAVQRINDIANNLLEQSRTKTQELASLKSGAPAENHEITSSKKSLEVSTQLLAPIIDTIISEKRIQFRDRINVHIEAELTQAYGLFIKANAIELKRVISNLVNNSVEAFVDSEGQVSVYIRRYGDHVHVIIQDNGKGIPSHVLSKLGEKGISHGKEGTQSGSGLGIFHAKETIQSFGGEFKIESKEGMGTTIYLIFPKADSPVWFVDELKISKSSKIIVLDDDQAIHNLWDGRLQSIRSHEQGIEVLHFSSLESVNDEVIKEAELLLVDYEFLGSKKTGLDFIIVNQLEDKCILVTSRYEEKSVLERCQKHGVRMIPKNMAAFIPIQIQEPKKRIDAVLLDDDSIIHMTWKMEAEAKKKNILMFAKYEELKLTLKDIPKEVLIYVDVNLGQGQPRGEVIAEELYKQGYKNIYLATGYESDQFNHLTWLKGVIGKEPKF